MYEAHFGLSANPFRLAPDPQFFYESSCHKRGLAYLRYGLHQGQGFVVVTGIPGTGKSLLVQTIFAEIAGRRMVVSSINNTNLEADDTLRAVANSFDVYCNDSSKAALLNALEKFLIEKHRQGKRVLLIVDEAQNLPPRSLEELRMLSNFQLGDQPLLQIMLLGQQQLQQILADPKLEQLTQRVIASCHLKPLEPAETRGYIEHRLRHVGWRGNPSFTGEALGLIYHCTQGIPRLINTFCDRLLLAAYLDEKQQIDADHVRTVLRELQSEATGAWQRINPNANPAMTLPPLPDGEFLPTDIRVEERNEDKPTTAVVTGEKKITQPAAAKSLNSFKPRVHTTESSAPVPKPSNPPAAGNRVPTSGGRLTTALAQQLQNEPEDEIPKAQRPVTRPPPKPSRDVVMDNVVNSNVVLLPFTQTQIDVDDQPPALVYKDTDAIVARRWWFVIGMLAVAMIVALLIIMLDRSGGKIGQIDSLQPAHPNLAATVQPEQVSSSRDDAIVANTTTTAQPEMAGSRQPYKNTAVPLEEITVTDEAVHTSAPRAPGLVAEPKREQEEHSEIIAVAAVKPSISEVELPGLINSYLFAYESGDIERFSNLFADNAIADKIIGRNKIRRDYNDLFQATEKRRMNINAVKWRQEGRVARGSGEFELVVWRRGNETPATIKGEIDIVAVKEENQLVIQKLTHVVNR